MMIKLNFLNNHQRTKNILLLCLILPGLAACSSLVDIATSAAPTAGLISPSLISPLTVSSLSLEKSFGNGAVQSGAWSPDGKTLALATSLRIDLYDAGSFQPTGVLDTGQWNTHLAYSPNGKLLAVNGAGGSIQIWDVGQQRRLQTLDNGESQAYGTKLLFSLDGTKLITSTGQTVHIWAVSSGQLLDTFPGYVDGIRSLAISLDGNFLVVASSKKIYVRNLSIRELLYPPLMLDEARESIDALFFDPDGKRFITVGSDALYLKDNPTPGKDYQSKIRYWDITSGKMLNEYNAGQSDVYGAAFSPDGHWIALSGETTVDIWDTSKSKISFSLPVGGPQTLAFSPDGNRLVTVAGSAQVWDICACQALKTFDEYSGTLYEAAFSSDGKLAAVVSNNIQVRDLEAGKVRYTFGGSQPLVFSPDGKKLAFASSKDSIGLVDTGTGQKLAADIPCPTLAGIAFSPDNKTIAFGGDGCKVTLQDVHSGKTLRILDKAQDNDGRYYVENLAFSPDGSKLVVAGHYTVEIWDIQTGALLQTIEGLNNSTQVAFSPNGRSLAISGFGGYSDHAKVQIWDTTSSRLIFILTTLQHQISKIAFSADGQLLAIGGDNTYSEEAPKIELWDAWSGQPLSKIEDTSDRVAGLAFRADGQALLSVRYDGSIHLWQSRSTSIAGLAPRPTPSSQPTQLPTLAAPLIKISKKTELGKGVSSHIFRSPDGKLAAHFEGHLLKWYNAADMTEIGSIDVGDNFWGNIIFSPDDKLMIMDSSFGAQIIDLTAKSIIGGVSGGNGSIDGYVFTRDGDYMAYLIEDHTTGGPYESIGLWDVAQRKDVFADGNYFPTLLSDRYHTMSAPAISPDGNLVAAGHSDRRVYVWDLRSGKTRFILEGHAQAVTSVDFSPDSQFLASGSMDGTIRLWNPASGKLVRVLTGFSRGISKIEFSRDGRSLIVNTDGDQPAQIYDLQSNDIKPAIVTQPTADPFELQQYQQGYTEGYYSDALFSPDGHTVALARLGVWLWDVGTGKLLRFIDIAPSGGLHSMAFSPNSKQLAVTTYDAMLLVLDSQSGQPVLTLQGRLVDGNVVYSAVNTPDPSTAGGNETALARGLAFSPDGALLAFGNAANIEIWDVHKASRVLSLGANQAASSVTQLSFSQDGKHLSATLNVENGRSLQVWEMETGQLLHKIDLPDPTGYVYGVSALHAPFFARNNTDDNGSWIEIWNLETEQYMKLDIPSAQSQPLVFSPDGSLLVAANGGALYFWKTSTGQLIYKTEADFNSSQLDISPDNKTLAIARDDKGELWDISQVAQFAQKMGAASLVPIATGTPAVIAWPTATPQPTPSAPTPTQSGSSYTKAITQANAAQVKEMSRFGQGTIEQANWSPSGASIVVAGSLGTFQYDGLLAETARLETDGLTYNAVSLPDGQVLAASVNAGHVQVRDMASAKILADLEGGGEPAISPDGKLLTYQDKDKNLQVWDIASKQVVFILYRDSSYSYYYPRWPVFSPDGKLVAAIQSADWMLGYANAVRIWDAHTGAILNALGGPDNNITDLSFSSDGRFVVGAAGGSAWIWQTQPGVAVDSINLYKVTVDYNLNLYDHTVTAVGISPDDKTIALGTSERVIWLYDRQSHKVLRKLEGHAAALTRLRFSPDGKSLLAVDKDGAILVWDMASGRQLGSVETHTGTIGGLVFRQDGNLSAWQAGSAWVLHPDDGKLLQTTQVHGGVILAANPTGDWLAVYDPFRVSLWDARTGKFRQTLEGEAENPFVDYHFEGLVFRQFSGAAFSADGSRLATAGTGGIWVYNTFDGKLLQQFPGTNARKLAFSPDNQWLLTCTYEQIQPPTILDLESGAGIFTLEENGRGSDFVQYAFSPDGRFVGAVKLGWDGPNELVLYDTASKQVFKRLPFGKDISLTSLAFSPASSLVAVGQADGQISLVDLSELKVISTLIGHHDQVEHLAFSPDGRYLISGSSDGTIRIWGIP